MKNWEERTKEEAYLLNPSFCTLLISATVNSFRSESNSDFPLILTFMILPLILHEKTRKALPASTRTSMVYWLQENPQSKIFFHEKVKSLKPHTLESLQFASKHNWLQVNEDGNLIDTIENRAINKVKRTLEEEARECFLKSIFLGKWFASVGDVRTILAMWGIKP